MFSASEKQDETWEFIKWWNSSDTQTSYAKSLEGVMGAAARYPAANINAIEQIPWPYEHYEQIMKQFKTVVGYPEVPGGYMSARQIDYAFRAVIEDGQNPREALFLYVDGINLELTKKRKEFGLTYDEIFD